MSTVKKLYLISCTVSQLSIQLMKNFLKTVHKFTFTLVAHTLILHLSLHVTCRSSLNASCIKLVFVLY